jgi:D-alanyl-D-alanine dipeptidase
LQIAHSFPQPPSEFYHPSVIIPIVKHFFKLLFCLGFATGCCFFPPALLAQSAGTITESILPGPKPTDAPLEWKQFVGIYGRDERAHITILERNGQLYFDASFLESQPDADIPINDYKNCCFSVVTSTGTKFQAALTKDTTRNSPTLLIIVLPPGHADIASGPQRYEIHEPWYFPRADAGADPGRFFHVTPVQPVAELRAKALKLAPPEEAGPFRKPELVELATLDPAIHLDIRYASEKNFLSTPVYTQARAFMQHPSAEALVRVLHKLQPLGYGLVIHDAYRPWYVTKIFWDATPPEGKIFVANPQEGSKHNRGCAVDLTLYDLATGQAIEMPGLYDEMSPRSFPNFPGGTSLQRWHRDLLRRAMESEGFTVNEDEWWHFDYKDWKQYGILNVPFEKMGTADRKQ